MAGGELWQGQWGPAVGSAVVLVVLPSTLPAGPQCSRRDGGGFPIPGSTQQGKDPNLCFPGFPKTLKEPSLYMTPFLTRCFCPCGGCSLYTAVEVCVVRFTAGECGKERRRVRRKGERPAGRLSRSPGRNGGGRAEEGPGSWATGGQSQGKLGLTGRGYGPGGSQVIAPHPPTEEEFCFPPELQT